jgi:hypothetical protein
MALGVNEPILSRDLRSVKDYYAGKNKAGKIFLLKGVGNSSVVIKDDSVDGRQVGSASGVMSAVHGNSKTVMLGPGEKGHIKSFCETELSLIAAYRPLGIVYKTAAEETDINSLLQQVNDFRSNFHKMSAQSVSDARGALETRLGGNKAELQNMVSTLKAPGGLESLGEIITADLVIGNTDRFFPVGWDTVDTSSRTKTIGGQQFEFQALINAGNVFVTLGPNGGASGLDYLDPQSLYKHMDNLLTDVEDANCEWPARILLDTQARSSFAESIIHDLELIFHPHKSRFSRKKKLGHNRKQRLVSGMVSGARKVVTKLQLGPATPAKTERINILLQVS